MLSIDHACVPDFGLLISLSSSLVTVRSSLSKQLSPKFICTPAAAAAGANLTGILVAKVIIFGL